MKLDKRGLTLLEFTVGLFLIGGAIVIYLQTIESSRKKNHFFSEHFIASILAAKTIETTYQETEINPYGLEALGLVDKNSKPFQFSSLITDGQTVFFKYPEITKKLTPGLFSFVDNDFQLVIATSLGKDNKNFFVDTSFKWPAPTGVGNFSYKTLFPSFTLKKEAYTNFALPDDQLEKKVVERIFEEKNKSIGTIISSPLAAKVALSTGQIYFSIVGLLCSPEFESNYQKAVKCSKLPLSPTSEDFAAGTEAYFKVARDIVDLMLYLKPHIENIKTNMKTISSLDLRKKSRLETFMYKAGHSLDKLRQVFFICLNDAASRYNEQIKESEDSSKQRFQIERCFNLHRILYTCKSFCSGVFSSANSALVIEKEYMDFLASIEKYFENRDPAIYRLANQEKKFAKKNELKKRYFTCKLIFDLFKVSEELRKILPPPAEGDFYKASVIGKESGDGTVAGAVTWARDQMAGGTRKGRNSNNGMTSKDPKAWNDWCLAFVATAYGRENEGLRAISAADALEGFLSKGKITNDKNPPAGAIMFSDKSPANPYGHIFIATGQKNSKGEPMVITSGWPGHDGITEMTLSEMIKVNGEEYYKGWTLPKDKEVSKP